MTYSFPSTVSTGDVLTASTFNQVIRENQKFGMATFTTEAARDAAITSPEEGMRAYLTAPASTTVTATGATTAVPSGITTVYNGSAWVCVTPVGALSNTTGTVASSASFASTLTGDTTAISVTLRTGTTAMLFATHRVANSSIGTVSTSISVSGDTTITAASSTFASLFATANANYQFMLPYVFMATGLNAGINTFTLNYKTDAGTLTLYQRCLTVVGVA